MMRSAVNVRDRHVEVAVLIDIDRAEAIRPRPGRTEWLGGEGAVAVPWALTCSRSCVPFPSQSPRAMSLASPTA